MKRSVRFQPALSLFFILLFVDRFPLLHFGSVVELVAEFELLALPSGAWCNVMYDFYTL